MEARYRKDYTGEFIVTRTHWGAGKKSQEREWVANPIENQHISGRAVCIVSDVTKDRFNYTRLARHRGGLLGSKKIQTYGTSNIALNMRLDFTVDTDVNKLIPLIDNDYYKNNVVYTTTRNCLLHPEKFYFIPYMPHLHPAALCPYLAAFDGHQEVFMIGYSKDTPISDPSWVNDITTILKTYKTTRFVFINVPGTLYDDWISCSNAEIMSVVDFISYCDIR